jgi:uncharacterized RDD family membrane protein YckC
VQASFFERIGAYFIDLIVVGILASIITYALPQNNNDLQGELNSLLEKINNNEISSEEYLTEYQNILYQNQKNNINENTLGLVITVAYFIVFGYLNKGRTIGKLVLKIKIVDSENKLEPSFGRILLRSIIPYGILSTTINLILINLISKHSYLNIYYLIGAAEIIFIVVTIFLISSKKPGLHDMLAHTEVIKEERRG